MGLYFSRSSLTDEPRGARSRPGPLPATEPRCAVCVLTSSPNARAGEAGARFRAWRSCSRYVAAVPGSASKARLVLPVCGPSWRV